MAAPTRDPLEAKLVAHVADLARKLGFDWEDPGGAFLLDPADRPVPTWRVFSEWTGGGVTADVRESDHAILKMVDIRLESSTDPDPSSDALRPLPADAIAPARVKVVDILGWPWPKDELAVRAEWDSAERVWRVRAGIVEAVLSGTRNTMRLISVSR